jgi:Ca2+-binding EF-hand superfamily protein
MRPLLTVAVTVVALAGAAWPQTPRSTVAPESRFAERFHQADANGDGSITVEEAQAAHLWFKEDFDSVDTDRSGTVTLFELAQALQQRLSHWLSDFDAADVNHDGQVSEEEAAQAPTFANVFTSIDRGKHQAVSRRQYESYAVERIYRDAELPSVAPNIFEKRF